MSGKFFCAPPTVGPQLRLCYVLYFVPLYIFCLYVWYTYFGFEEYFEAGCIAMASIGVLQTLCCLFCTWFISFKCLLTCSSVSFDHDVIASTPCTS